MATIHAVLNNPENVQEPPFIECDSWKHAVQVGPLRKDLPRIDGDTNDRPIRTTAIFRELWSGTPEFNAGQNAEQRGMEEFMKFAPGDDFCLLMSRVPSFRHMKMMSVKVSCGDAGEDAPQGLKFCYEIRKRSDNSVVKKIDVADGLAATSLRDYFDYDDTAYTLEGEDEYLMYLRFTELPFLVDGMNCWADPCLPKPCYCIQIRLITEATCCYFETLSDDFKCCPEEEECDPCDPDCNCPEKEEEPKPEPAKQEAKADKKKATGGKK